MLQLVQPLILSCVFCFLLHNLQFLDSVIVVVFHFFICATISFFATSLGEEVLKCDALS